MVDPIKEKFASCRKFLGYMYDVSYEKDLKKIATTYLNASIDVFNSSYDTKISDAEQSERNKCVELALKEGADPDSNGKEKKADSYLFETPAPIVRAVRNDNVEAVKLLLEYKANPNAEDTTMGKAIPLLNTAIYKPSQEIALLLIDAGSDLTTPNLLWIAAGNAADKVVELLLESNKIPVNQLAKFSSFDDDGGQTALDSSEYRLFALNKYQKNFSGNSRLSIQDKVMEANRILYYNYPLMPQLKMKDAVDPDEFMTDLFTRQQAVSDMLKAAGGVCKEENCGIIDFSN